MIRHLPSLWRTAWRTAREASTRHRLVWEALLWMPACIYFWTTDFSTGGWLGMPQFLLHSINLIAHEAGHWVFGLFGALGSTGRFIEIAGGSVMQLLFPCLWGWIALLGSTTRGMQLCLLWLGQSFLDVSHYAADAQARALPLLGGLGPEAHDWHNMLAMTGTLEHTPLISGLIATCALPVWGLMLVLPHLMGDV